MIKSNRWGLALVALTCTAALVGCGDDSSPAQQEGAPASENTATPTPAAMSKELKAALEEEKTNPRLLVCPHSDGSFSRLMVGSTVPGKEQVEVRKAPMPAAEKERRCALLKQEQAKSKKLIEERTQKAEEN